MASEMVLFEVRDGVAHVTLNRPDAANSLLLGLGVALNAISGNVLVPGGCLIADSPEASGINLGKLKERVLREGAGVLYNPDRIDYHIYTHWVPIMHQRAWSTQDGPWRWAKRGNA